MKKLIRNFLKSIIIEAVGDLRPKYDILQDLIDKNYTSAHNFLIENDLTKCKLHQEVIDGRSISRSMRNELIQRYFNTVYSKENLEEVAVTTHNSDEIFIASYIEK